MAKSVKKQITKSTYTFVKRKKLKQNAVTKSGSKKKQIKKITVKKKLKLLNTFKLFFLFLFVNRNKDNNI